MRQLLLHVIPRKDGTYGVELRQRVNGEKGVQEKSIVRVWGLPMEVATELIVESLRRSGYRVSDLHRNRKTPFELREEWGVRLGLALLVLKPMRKFIRMERIAEAIRAMPDEEAYYWFSNCTSSHRAQVALRTLFR